MLARLSAFVIWGMVAATLVFWGLRLLVRSPAAPSYAVAVGDSVIARGDLSRLLGNTPAATAAPMASPDAAARFHLLGVAAHDAIAGGAHGDVALIAVDGKMAKAYPVGASLDGSYVLQSVGRRSASIGDGRSAPTITLELAPPTPAATGTLANGGGSAGAFVPATAPVPQVAPPQFMPQATPAQPVPHTGRLRGDDSPSAMPTQ